MELEEKQAVAAALLERHAALYDVAIPKKLSVLYASVGAFNMGGKCPPSWDD